MIKKIFESIWLFLFAHAKMQRWNQYLLNLAQKNLGINNYNSDRISGEIFWTKFVLDNYQPNVVFDIGAHIGDYTSLLRQSGYKKTIFLFEPHPKTYANLADKVMPDQFTHLFNIGFSDSRNVSLIFDYPENDKNSGSPHASLYSEVITDLHGAKETLGIEIKLRTLDDFVEDQKLNHISLLKIDTEGNEYPILKGAKKLLEEDRIDLLQFEFGEMNVVSKYFFKDFFDLLHNKYKLYRLLPTGLLPIEKYNARHHEIFIYQNIVGIHRKLFK